MHRTPPSSWTIALALAAMAASPGGSLSAQSLPEAIRTRIEAGLMADTFGVGGNRVRSARDVPEFYLRRGYRPAWVTLSGTLTPAVDTLLTVLREAPTHGLEGAHRRAVTLDAFRRRIQRPGAPPRVWDLADLDILLSDAFLALGAQLLHGRVDADQVPSERISTPPPRDLPAILTRALDRGDVRGELESLAPPQPEYARLREALAQLRDAAARGGWPVVAEGPTLREGDVDPRIAAVRRRLASSAETREQELARAPGALLETFTPELTEAVRSFQHRHGLEMDGAVGGLTLEAMNVPVQDRIRQVQVNMERWRWIPQDLGTRHIRVNIAAFETEVWDQGAVVMRLRSIVGRQYRMTPSFTAPLRYLVFAPYWNVPPNIAAVDKLPEIRRDPGYLARLRYTLLDLRTDEAVDPWSVDWSAVTGADFNRRYRLRQDPGPLNALGRVKFMFPNPYHVYLHDTPDRHLFQQAQRDFSSGCIRIEHPMELAAFLLADDPTWTREAMATAAGAGVERTVFLGEPIPVHVLYMTAFVDAEGHVHFRSDLYGRDAVVMAALAASSPVP